MLVVEQGFRRFCIQWIVLKFSPNIKMPLVTRRMQSRAKKDLQFNVFQSAREGDAATRVEALAPQSAFAVFIGEGV